MRIDTGPDTGSHPRPLVINSRVARVLLWIAGGLCFGLAGWYMVVGMQDGELVPGATLTTVPSGDAMPGMLANPTSQGSSGPIPTPTPPHSSMSQLMSGMVPTATLGFDPSAMLTDFDYGNVTQLPNGQIRRDYTIVEHDRRIEVSPGVFFDAWTYNGRIPGPTLRATEGDLIHVTFINDGSVPHSIHFHGIHPADQDGLEPVQPGAPRVYEFVAGPVGVQLYHCHIEPLAEHIDRGLYGVFIIDPRTPRTPAHELVMMMNAFDLNDDGENDIYAVNSIPFAYYFRPISLAVGEKVRIYLANMMDIDPINSFHLHGNFFWLYRTGSRNEPDEYTDTLMLSQGERAILEFTYTMPGEYMFHAHQAQFSDKGWMGCFTVQAAGSSPAPSGACSAASHLAP